MDFLTAARERAKELVNLPDLDAMAADDDYIHSETLNVSSTKPTTTTTTTTSSKQPPPYETQQQSSSFFIRQDSLSSHQSSDYPVTPAPSSAPTSWTAAASQGGGGGAGALLHMGSSSSSWSLLDRKPTTNRISTNPSNSSLKVEEATARLNAMVFDTASGSNSNTNFGESSSHHSQRVRVASTASSQASQTLSMSDDDDDGEHDANDDDASQDSYDADDPILPLIQQQQQQSRKGGGANKGSKNRFMNELDQRLAKPSVPENQGGSSHVNPLEMEGNSQSSLLPPRRLWPWQKSKPSPQTKTNPSNNGNTDDEEEGNATSRPLWARPKKKKSKAVAVDDSFVMVSSGNLGFSEEEKQALANLQQSAAKESSGNILSDHPRESFVALTLVLGAGVYFFSRMTAADDFA